MSAYVVTRQHVAYLAAMAGKRADRTSTALSWYWGGRSTNLKAGDMVEGAKLANLLWAENRESVQARYGDTDLPGDEKDIRAISVVDVAEQALRLFDPVQVLKSCACLGYQSCEHDGWEGSEACEILEALKARTIRALPGYEKAAWGSP